MATKLMGQIDLPPKPNSVEREDAKNCLDNYVRREQLLGQIFKTN